MNIKQILSINIFHVLISAAAILVLSFGFAAPAVSAQDGNFDDALCAGVNISENPDECNEEDLNKSDGKIQGTISTILNVFSWIVGIASVVMIIFAGFKYVLSQGGEGTAQARNTILYAVIGIVIVALAQAIVQFVLKRV